MVFEHEAVDGILRINVLNSIYGITIEDSPVVMGVVIDKILQVRKVERIILAETREYEYDFEQTTMLAELARTLDKLLNEYKILSISKVAAPRCDKFAPKWFANLQFILLEMFKRDPIGTYVKVKREIRKIENKLRSSEDPLVRRCYTHYLRNALLPLRNSLEKTKIIQLVKDRLTGYRIGDRGLYREIFHPLIRPNFMLTRYMATPPKGGRLIERYKIGDNIRVEIFKIPGKVRPFYFVVPPEFRLPEEKYTLLDTARRYMAEHRPTRVELAEPERAREVFTNIGRDMIKELAASMRIRLTATEVEQLASILCRYTAGFGILEILLADERIQDVYINSPIGLTPVYIYHSDFEECETNLIPTREDAEAWATRFRMFSGRPLDEANPVLDTELLVPGGRARVCAITRTLSPEGLAYTFRRHREKPWTFPLFIKVKFFDSLYAGLMSFIADGGRSCLIAGGRSAGKTSLLSALMLEIMKKFRIVVTEDTLELPVVQLRNLGYNIERLKSRSVITRVEAELPADEALRVALRLGDSVLIVGEVRSREARALFEAMRIGAMANMVAGTIHGESPYGVFDRVVNDLGVPRTSFKAIDLITICSMLRSPDGIHRFRRVTELTEVRKYWKEDPLDEGAFVPLMEYDAKEDKLRPTDTLVNGESYVLNEIMKKVREWHDNWDAVWNNIELRAKIKQTMVDYARKFNRPDILEADFVVDSNEAFHIIGDKVRQEVGSLDNKLIYERWLEWFKSRLKEK